MRIFCVGVSRSVSFACSLFKLIELYLKMSVIFFSIAIKVWYYSKASVTSPPRSNLRHLVTSRVLCTGCQYLHHTSLRTTCNRSVFRLRATAPHMSMTSQRCSSRLSTSSGEHTWQREVSSDMVSLYTLCELLSVMICLLKPAMSIWQSSTWTIS